MGRAAKYSLAAARRSQRLRRFAARTARGWELKLLFLLLLPLAAVEILGLAATTPPFPASSPSSS